MGVVVVVFAQRGGHCSGGHCIAQDPNTNGASAIANFLVNWAIEVCLARVVSSVFDAVLLASISFVVKAMGLEIRHATSTCIHGKTFLPIGHTSHVPETWDNYNLLKYIAV